MVNGVKQRAGELNDNNYNKIAVKSSSSFFVWRFFTAILLYKHKKKYTINYYLF